MLENNLIFRDLLAKQDQPTSYEIIKDIERQDKPIPDDGMCGMRSKEPICGNKYNKILMEQGGASGTSSSYSGKGVSDYLCGQCFKRLDKDHICKNPNCSRNKKDKRLECNCGGTEKGLKHFEYCNLLKQDKPVCEHKIIVYGDGSRYDTADCKWLELSTTQTTKHLDCEHKKVIGLTADSYCTKCGKSFNKHLDKLVVPEKIEAHTVISRSSTKVNYGFTPEDNKINELIDFNKQLLISLKE